MQNVIVGTASHVDYGKTCLIKALTRTDTDRLKEEQERGITIESGFANLSNDTGICIGIIDASGHEKFVENMLVSIGGIDLVPLVVTLDKGVMLQTVGHFEILKMLHIRQGIVVFTKADPVDEEWVGLIDNDMDNLVRGTLIENADCIQVSTYTGKNIDMLRRMIMDKIRAADVRRQEKKLPRLLIDHVFAIKRSGTAVIGAPLEGCCQVEQKMELCPTERTVKIREIQTHGHKVDMAYAGQRTALNLINIKKDEINKGEVLAVQDSLLRSQFMDAKVQLFPSTNRELRNGDRVHISYGSAQAICKAVLLDRDMLSVDEEAYAQFRLDEPVAVRRNDRFIIRFYSPAITLGEGIVLEAGALKHKGDHEDVIDNLRTKELGTNLKILELELREEGRCFPAPKILTVKFNWTNQETEDQLETLVKGKKAVRLSDDSYIHKHHWNEITQYGTELLNQFYEENSISDEMKREEFRSRVLGNFRIQESKKVNVLLNKVIERGTTVAIGSAVAVAGFNAEYPYEVKGMLKEIKDAYLMAGYEIPAIDDVVNESKDRKLAERTMSDLVKKGALVKINPDAMIYEDNWEKAMGFLKKYFENHPTISLGDYRDLLGISGKYTVLLLEYRSQQKITRGQDDVRILVQKSRQADMEFRQLEAFVNTVKYKNSSRATDTSFLAQPTISAHISNLENELGITFVNQTGRKVTLTKQGGPFYPYAIDMLHTRSQTLAMVQAQCKATDDILDIYASSIPGQYYLPRLIGEFHTKCLRIRFYVEQSDSKTVVEDIMSRKGETGFIGYKMHDSLVYEPVFMDELVLIVPDTEKYSRWKKGSIVSFRDFEHKTFILREGGSGTKQGVEKAEVHGVSVFRNVDVITRTNSTEAIKQAVAGGLEISIPSRMAAGEEKESYQTKHFKIDGLGEKWTSYMVYNKNTRLSLIVEVLRDLVIDYRDRNWQQDIGRFM